MLPWILFAGLGPIAAAVVINEFAFSATLFPSDPAVTAAGLALWGTIVTSALAGYYRDRARPALRDAAIWLFIVAVVGLIAWYCGEYRTRGWPW